MSNHTTAESITVFWNDASGYSSVQAIRSPTPMKTTGTIVSETDQHLILKNPKTFIVNDEANEFVEKARRRHIYTFLAA